MFPDWNYGIGLLDYESIDVITEESRIYSALRLEVSYHK